MRAANDVALQPLQRFGHLDAQRREALFAVPPRSPRDAVGARAVGVSLGALLYGPATAPGTAQRLLSGFWPSLTAIVLCLEDAVADVRLEDAEALLTETLESIANELEHGRPRASVPFVFVRVRGPEHLERLLARLGPLSRELDGVVLPKVTVPSVARFLAVMRHAQRDRDRPLWAMPILEGPDTAHRERRMETLLGLKELLAAYRDLVPCIRIGATDLSGLWGLRRSRDFTVYDLAAVADVIADVVNVFGRADGAPAISGPVWEYIHDEQVFKPLLRETPFTEAFGADGADRREALLSSAIDGLLREALLDRVNGLHGKTVIHPSHVAPVDAVYAVSHSEHQDALAILRAGGGAGVEGLTVGARMNEPKPHRLWAERTLERGEAFGVLREDRTFIELVPAGRPRA